MSTPKSPLRKFDGRDVIQATIKVTRAGDGLSKALAIDLREIKVGETVYVVLETECTKITFEEIGETGTLRRVATLATHTGSLVDGTLVGEAIEATKLAIEKAKGVERLEFDEGDSE